MDKITGIKPTLPRQLARTQRFTLGVPRAFTLLPDGSGAVFLRTHGPEDRTGCLWLRDAAGERLLVAPSALPAPSAGVPQAELDRRERARERSGGIVAYSADDAVRTLAFAVDGALWALDLGAGGRPRLLNTAGPAVDPRIDPTGHRIAYVTDGALHVTDLATADGSRDLQLAASEHADVTYGLAEHVAAEEMHRLRGFWWSPDGLQLLVARVDTSRVQRWWISDPANPARPPRAIRYPAAGTANADVSLHVIGLDGNRTEVRWDRVAYEYLATVAWDAHGPLLSVQSRDQRTVRVLTADPHSGATRLLHEQRDPAWVALVPGTPARTATAALVYTVDEGDTRRLTVGGEPVTPDGLQVREVVSVDGASVLFLGGDEPTEQHLWSYDAATGLRRLTTTPGVHTGQRAAGTLLLASHADGRHEFRLTAAKPDGPAKPYGPDRPNGPNQGLTIASLGAESVVAPRVTWLQAGDLKIRCALLLPSWYEPGGEPLPVLMKPYAGAGMQLVTRAVGWALTEAQWFAEEGFAVVVADGRGTPGRGPRWEKTVHGDTLSAPIADQVTALHAAAAHCPDLDLGKVAIRGWSYGGTLAVAAVLRRPDIFHAAVSGAGPSDQRLYDTHWRERFLGHPDDEPAAYERCSPIGEAAALRRPLLLIHGLSDDNVVPAHTLRLSAALLAAQRPHQVLPLANTTHAPTDEVQVEGLLRHQLDFLRASLSVPPRPAV